MAYNLNSKDGWKMAGGLIALWFALVTIWPLTFWWLDFLQKHLGKVQR